MHRALCRVIRGTCRKFRENDCPNIAGEEVRQNRSKSKEDFTTPRHSATEALGWTAGILLTYEFTHRRRCHQNVFEDCVSVSTNRAVQGYLQKCPFAVATKAIAQPTLSTSTVGHNVRAEHERRPRSFLTSRKSIDTTPFLFEKSGNEKFLHGLKYSDRKSIDLDGDSEDEGVHFDETISQFDEVRNAKPRNATSVALAEKLTGDLFSALGAFNFLTSSEDGTKSGSMNEVVGAGPPPMSPLEILEKGAELGSSRALYNIGVAYDRMKEVKLAGEYYRRAADLGHPLATYNVAVLTLQDGKISEGLALMRFAAENGIPEARAVIDSA